MSESQISTDNTDFTDILFTVFQSKIKASLKAEKTKPKVSVSSFHLRKSVIQKCFFEIVYLFGKVE
jgi:hypothetical protein